MLASPSADNRVRTVATANGGLREATDAANDHATVDLLLLILPLGCSQYRFKAGITAGPRGSSSVRTARLVHGETD